MGEFERIIAAKQAKAQAALRAKNQAAQQPPQPPRPAAERPASVGPCETVWGLVAENDSPKPSPKARQQSKLKQPTRLPKQHKALLCRDRSPRASPAAQEEFVPPQNRARSQQPSPAIPDPPRSARSGRSHVPNQPPLISPGPRGGGPHAPVAHSPVTHSPVARSPSPHRSAAARSPVDDEVARKREKQRQYQAELALQVAERKAREEDQKRLQREAERAYLERTQPHAPQAPRAQGRARVQSTPRQEPEFIESPPTIHQPPPQETPQQPHHEHGRQHRQQQHSEAPAQHERHQREHQHQHQQHQQGSSGSCEEKILIYGETEAEENARKQAEKEAWQREVAAQIAAKKAKKDADIAAQKELDRLDDERVMREQAQMAARFAAETKAKQTPREAPEAPGVANSPPGLVAAKSPVMHSPRPAPILTASPVASPPVPTLRCPVANSPAGGLESGEEDEPEDSIFGLAAESNAAAPRRPVVHTPREAAQPMSPEAVLNDELRAELEEMRRVAEEAEEARRIAESKVEALNRELRGKGAGAAGKKPPGDRRAPKKDKPVALQLQRREPAAGVVDRLKPEAKPRKKTTDERLEEVKKRREALDKEKEGQAAQGRRGPRAPPAPPARKQPARPRQVPTEPGVKRRQRRSEVAPRASPVAVERGVERELPSSSRMENRANEAVSWQGSLVDLGSQMVYQHGADRGCTPEELQLMLKAADEMGGMEEGVGEESMAHGTLMVGMGEEWAKDLAQLQNAVSAAPVSLMPKWDDMDERYFG